MRVVLDTCILKLATFPAENNASALIFELTRAGLIEAWVSPAILEEYADVLSDHLEFLAEIVESFAVCYPLTTALTWAAPPDCASTTHYERRANRAGCPRILLSCYYRAS